MDQYEIATAMLIDEYVLISILGLEFFLVIERRRWSNWGYNFGRYSVISSCCFL